MNLLRSSFLTLSAVIYCLSSNAQDYLPDKVMANQVYIDAIKANYVAENAYPFDLSAINLSVKIPVRVHIVRNSKGTTGVNTSVVKTSISTVNGYFKNIGIQFFIDSINVINDYNYSFVSKDRNTTELLTKYALIDRINLFLVDSIIMDTEKTYGYTYFPTATDSNFIFLDKNYVSGNYLVTQMGHFMGLLSTHDSGGGAELVSEKNCDASGDFICDTYADPDLYTQVDSTCQYTGSSRDGNGKYYVPSVANMMSNSEDLCKCVITPLQYRRMYYYYLKYRQTLKY